MGRRAASSLRSRCCELVGAKYTPPQGVPRVGLRLRHAGLGGPGPGRHAPARFDDWNAAWEQFQRQGKFPARGGGKTQSADPRRTDRQRGRGGRGRGPRRRQRRGPLPLRLALSEQLPARGVLLADGPGGAAAALAGLPLRDALGGRPRGHPPGRRRLAGNPPADRSLPQDLLRQHAPLLDARLHHFAGGDDSPRRRRLSPGRRERLRLGRLQRLLRPDVYARLGLRAEPRPALPRSGKTDAADRLQAPAAARRRREQPH